MPCGWEGNRRSGIALAMRHRLQWFIHLRAHGLRKGDEHPAYNRHGVWHALLYFLPVSTGREHECVPIQKVHTHYACLRLVNTGRKHGNVELCIKEICTKLQFSSVPFGGCKPSHWNTVDPELVEQMSPAKRRLSGSARTLLTSLGRLAAR